MSLPEDPFSDTVAFQGSFFSLPVIFSLHDRILEIEQEKPRAEILFPDPIPPVKRIGALSCSANPPTLAHLQILKKAKEALQLDLALYLLSIENADKTPSGARFEDRILMMLSSLAGEEGLGVAVANKGLFVEQLEGLRVHFPKGETEIFFIVGHDTLERIFQTKYYQDRDETLGRLFKGSRFIAANREKMGEREIEELLSRPENKPFKSSIHPLTLPGEFSFVSSTEIRSRLLKDKSAEHWLAPGVKTFLDHSGLYRSPRKFSDGQERELYEIRSQIIDYCLMTRHQLESPENLKRAVQTATNDSDQGGQIRHLLGLPPDALSSEQRQELDAILRLCFTD